MTQTEKYNIFLSRFKFDTYVVIDSFYFTISAVVNGLRFLQTKQNNTFLLLPNFILKWKEFSTN